MSERRLISTRRTIPSSSRAEYERAWERLRALATGAGARAWRFYAAEDPLRFVEFLEFRGGGDPREGAEARAALDSLEAIAHGAAEEWLDATPRPELPEK